MTDTAPTTDTPSSPPFDVYIRFNGDEERDYCFQVRPETTFGDLIEIFKTLPLNLSPSIFFERIPSHFQLSTSPGVLTMEGGILFGEDAEKKKFLKTMRNSDLIATKAWPGQLIVPVFPERTFVKSSVIAALAVWLYTDLPDAISPTPGHSLLTLLVSIAAYVMTNYLNMAEQSAKMVENTLTPAPITAQCIFFGIHVVKVLVIYFILWVGGFNPYSMFGRAPSIDREDLVKIGWTSAKKADVMDFTKEYRDYRTNLAGGILKAHQIGLLDKLRRSSVALGSGEGFQSPLVDELPKDTPEDGKFRLSFKYLKQQEEFFQERYSKVSDIEFATEYKHLRRFGPFDAPESIEKLAEERIKLGNGDVKPKE
ncbi:DEKNAAC104287 [Brettanomyces naardenensis]|uniref:DEKNAAC104287 n=1 Tax=Brettanomyces naardenensis TaxID=13370 RepID=A0A448YPR8_BRENA|nr:DEKNAAC104287 [Brettanomyces naardenensis]